MALSDQGDFPAIFRLRKMTIGISSIPEYDNPLSPLLRKMAKFPKIDFPELTDCGKSM